MDDTETHMAKDAAKNWDPLPAASPIVIPADRLKKGIPWILRDERYADDALDADVQRLLEQDDFDVKEVSALEDANKAKFSGRWWSHALTDAQVQVIAERFSFSEEAMQQLSSRLARALNPDVTPATISLQRESAERSASEKAERGLKHLMIASEEAIKALELFASLFSEEAPDRKAVERFKQQLQDHENVLIAIERLHRRYGYLAGITGLTLDRDIVDQRSIADLRRQKVLETLFDFWAEHGRKLSVTTDPIEKSRRKGPLVDFVREAVLAVTDPPTELSGETIWQDLKAFKAVRGKD